AARQLEVVEKGGVVLRPRKGPRKMLEPDRLWQPERPEQQPEERIADQQQQQGNPEAEQDALEAKATGRRGRGDGGRAARGAGGGGGPPGAGLCGAGPAAGPPTPPAVRAL